MPEYLMPFNTNPERFAHETIRSKRPVNTQAAEIKATPNWREYAGSGFTMRPS
ncbi:hypothetical protein [Mucilaginibacter sp.]|uniref:hypothetical protein n=1 Tax=Mucilaginibacter sp. TaxID=1882438 RepID=UPI0025FE9A48|nr:hypothetical protein [Mucilaginibacter sp.]